MRGGDMGSRSGYMRFYAACLATLSVLIVAPSAHAATSYIYWSDDTSWGTNSIGRANADASGVTPSFIRDSAYSLATAGPYIYFASGNTIGRADLDGTNVQPNFITLGTDTASLTTGGLAVTDQYIYWSDGGGISRANLDGTGQSIDYIHGLTGKVVSLAVDSQHIYWGEQETGTDNDRIGRANLDGTGVSETFMTGLAYIDGIAVDSQYIFWANNSDTPTVGRANLDGRDVQPTLVGGSLDAIGSIGQIALDDQYVYWADYAQHTIGRANLDGTGFIPAFTRTEANPHGLALSGSATPPGPSVATSEASGITDAQATLNGSVTSTGAQITDCHFDWGTTTSYGDTAPCNPTPGNGTTPVSATISGLSAGSTYHFRLVATDSNGGGVGNDATFTTEQATLVGAPSVVTGQAAGVTGQSLTFTATVNPEGTQITDCHFEFGTTVAYGSSAPCAQAVGSGTGGVQVSAAVAGLAPGTTYHYRIVATNGKGTSDGADETVTTNTPPTCSNSYFSSYVAGTVTIPLACSDPDGDLITISVVSGPQRGSLGAVNQAAKTVTYTPGSGFSGSDSFTIRASDGFASSKLAMVSIFPPLASPPPTVEGGGGGSGNGGGASNGGPGVVVCNLQTGTCSQPTTCSPGANTVCGGQVTYSTQPGGPAGDASTAKRKRSKSVLIGRAVFSIPAGRSRLVRVRLTRNGMRLLRLHHRLRVLEVITSHDEAGHHWSHQRWMVLRLGRQRGRA